MARVVAAARRYAQAVFEVAREKNELDRWATDLEKISTAVQKPEVLAVLENPKIHLEAKRDILQDAIADLTPLELNFISVLIQKSRLAVLPQIVAEYQRMLDAYNGIQRADVVTAVPLEEQDRETLKQKLSAMTGKKIVLTTRVDPSILGGFVARIGDRLIDGSVVSNLLSLKRRLSGEAG